MHNSWYHASHKTVTTFTQHGCLHTSLQHAHKTNTARTVQLFSTTTRPHAVFTVIDHKNQNSTCSCLFLQNVHMLSSQSLITKPKQHLQLFISKRQHAVFTVIYHKTCETLTNGRMMVNGRWGGGQAKTMMAVVNVTENRGQGSFRICKRKIPDPNMVFQTNEYHSTLPYKLKLKLFQH